MDIQLLRETAECDRSDFEFYRKVLLSEAVLNEKFGNITKGFKEMLFGHVRKAKSYMHDAESQLKKGNKSEAKAALSKAIDEIKAGRKEAEQMDDDSVLEQFIIQMIVGCGPIITGCAAAMYIGIGISGIFGMLRICSQQKMLNDPKHAREVNARIKGKDAAEAYGISCKASLELTRYQLLEAYDELIKDCETLKKNIK